MCRCIKKKQSIEDTTTDLMNYNDLSLKTYLSIFAFRIQFLRFTITHKRFQ